eukprot:TRINITY_DN27037_c0_g1_i1.p1 TRINITY_DN27037_c0_g1~~TRINITY_DN27037_c0_g1_i1.p1  ORF type:complete len:347 (+),score=53.62 TRINITY_DN27037_c0_g1_i1:80-1042(+)
MGASNSRSRRDNRERERERRERERMATAQARHQQQQQMHQRAQYIAQSRYPGSHIAMQHNHQHRQAPGGYQHYVHHPPQQQQAPMVQAPEVQVTKTVKNKAAIAKRTIKLEGTTLRFELDALSEGVARVYMNCDEVLQDGVLEMATKKDVVECPFGEGGEIKQEFELDELEKDKGTYHIVIALWYEGEDGEAAQLTYCALEETGLEVTRQTLWVGQELFLLEEIYGMEEAPENEQAVTAQLPSSYQEATQDSSCVVCMTDERDTTIMPCRHMCLCSPCADSLRQATNKCPICRTTIVSLLQIKKSEPQAAEGEEGTVPSS